VKTLNLLVALLAVLPAQGQTMKTDSTRKVIGILDCISYAQTHNLDLRVSELSLQTTQSEKNQAFSQMLPGLQAGAGHTWSAQPDAQTGEKYRQSATAQISGSLDLFSGARQWSSWNQASSAADAGKYDLDARKNELKLTVIQAYIQVLLNRERLISANAQTEISSRNLVRIRAKKNLGLVSDYQLLQAESQLAGDESAAIGRESDLRLAELNLKQVMNYPTDSLISIRVDIPPAVQATLQDSSVSLEPAYLAAKSGLPEIQAARLSAAASSWGLTSAKGAWFPSLSLTYGISTSWSAQAQTQSLTGGTRLVQVGVLASDPSQAVVASQPVSSWKTTGFAVQVKQNWSPYVGLNLSFPILDNRSRETRIELAEIQVSRAALSEKQTDLFIRKKVETAVFAYRNSLKQSEASGYALTLARSAFAQTEQRLGQGLVSGFDYLTEKNNLQKTETEYLLVKYQHVLNRLTLDFYLQKDLEW